MFGRFKQSRKRRISEWLKRLRNPASTTDFKGIFDWGVLGTAIASSPIIAETFFATKIFGVIVSATTPIGWLIGAFFVAGGLYWVTQLVKGEEKGRRFPWTPKRRWK